MATMPFEWSEEEKEVLARNEAYIVDAVSAAQEGQIRREEIERVASEVELPAWKLARFAKEQGVAVNLLHFPRPEVLEARRMGRKRFLEETGEERTNWAESGKKRGRPQKFDKPDKPQKKGRSANPDGYLMQDDKKEKAQDALDRALIRALNGETFVDDKGHVDFREVSREEAEAEMAEREQTIREEVAMAADFVRQEAVRELPVEFVPESQYITVKALAMILEQFSDDTIIQVKGKPARSVFATMVWRADGAQLKESVNIQ